MDGIVSCEGGVTLAKGFKACAVEAAIKRPGRLDVALIVADEPCEAVCAFTTNQVAAAPVVYNRSVLSLGKGRVRAIIANSGCANACTGEQGLQDVKRIVAATAKKLQIAESEVLVASTGVIGRLLPVDRLLAGMEKAAEGLDAGRETDGNCARAIMTTDTVSKQAACKVRIGGADVVIGGMTKGSGMIEPNMATMLAFITTDAAIAPALLHRAMFRALGRSFNRLVVDGDESTNDSLFVMSSAKAGNAPIESLGEDFERFCEGLECVMVSLARQMAKDGEGATKFVTVTVKGAETEHDAEKAARAIAKSPLAKTSWFGKDPNWGRVLAAAGYSGARVVDMKAEVFYGDEWAFRRGEVAGKEQLARLEKVMEHDELAVTVDLHLGDGQATIYTCDFSLDYVHINADYTT